MLAFWPVWDWFIRRTFDSSDEPWGLLALATLLLFLARKTEEPAGSLVLPAVMVLGYAVAAPFSPPLVAAVLAVTALAATVSQTRFGISMHLGVWGLALLSLPLLSSLQFYLGYPLRLLAGAGAAALVRLSGLPVFSDGALLCWGSQAVAVDAPCSGIRMLWAGLYLVFGLACFCGWRQRTTVAMVAVALLAVLLGNVFRSASLFFLEAGLVGAPAWVHPGVGVVVFVGVAATIAGFGRRWGEEP